MTDTSNEAEPAAAAVEPAPATMPVVAKYNTKAVIGLILSAISVLLVLVPVVNLLLAVPGIILGVLGRNEIAVSGERSRPVALGAIWLGALSAGLSLLLVIGVGVAGVGIAHQVHPGGDSDACTSTTGDFTQKQLQACFDSQNN